MRTIAGQGIATQGLRKRFGTIQAVDSLDLNVPRRSIYGFLGPNGAGKTTTIRMLEATRRLIGADPSSIGDTLDMVGLRGASNRLVREYSTGMRQRLGIALALLGAPELLVLDEPMNGLDPGGMQEIRELIRALPARLGVTVFLSSHLLSEVEQVATHVGIIQQGRLAIQGSVDSILAGERCLRVTVSDPAPVCGAIF